MTSVCYIGNDINIGCSDPQENIVTCQEVQDISKEKEPVVEKMNNDNNTNICPNGKGCLPLQVDHNDGKGCVYSEECKEKNNKFCGFGKVNAKDCSGVCVPKTRYEISVGKAILLVILFSMFICAMIYYFTVGALFDSVKKLVTSPFTSADKLVSNVVDQISNNKVVSNAVSQISNSNAVANAVSQISNSNAVANAVNQISNSNAVNQISNSNLVGEAAEKVKSNPVFNFIENMISKSVKKVADESKNLTK
jgi:hypothetical protein